VAGSDSVGAPGKVAMGLRRMANRRCSDCARGRGPADLRGGEKDWTQGHTKKDKRNGYDGGSSGEGTRWLTDSDGARRAGAMEERRSGKWRSGGVGAEWKSRMGATPPHSIYRSRWEVRREWVWV
jgi:hypothetical protein